MDGSKLSREFASSVVQSERRVEHSIIMEHLCKLESIKDTSGRGAQMSHSRYVATSVTVHHKQRACQYK